MLLFIYKFLFPLNRLIPIFQTLFILKSNKFIILSLYHLLPQLFVAFLRLFHLLVYFLFLRLLLFLNDHIIFGLRIWLFLFFFLLFLVSLQYLGGISPVVHIHQN
mmetsp:Transcript_9845/g.9695  ORF Transcript_9845/g.9695 Transcript_9845/m.9695 type:complete len:105 (+) Transcript_9845:364-678(+)